MPPEAKYGDVFEAIAKAQLRKVVEEMEKPCPHDTDSKLFTQQVKRQCDICWSELRKESL